MFWELSYAEEALRPAQSLRCGHPFIPEICPKEVTECGGKRIASPGGHDIRGKRVLAEPVSLVRMR
ncbi:hypothetical protein OG245_00605 [Streptomyces sp. NBC_01116]|uniref:hypothetical protein n=1 Tax=Streptomyces sp. NBC_01116 TaxID=2903752 RepID=UPI00324ECBF0